MVRIQTGWLRTWWLPRVPGRGSLLDPVGVKVPLQTERGHHTMLPSPSVEPRYTISYKSRGFGMTPMEGGLRVAGTVEIAGLSAPPDERRALTRRASPLDGI